MGVRGATAASEAAGIVLTTDRIDRLADAIGIAHRSRRIAVRADSGVDDLTPDQLSSLSGDLYGLYALLVLHFAQEEENYFALTG
jgi:hypothetical protein